MKSVKLALLYGFLVWAVPFAMAFLAFPLRESNRPLFESIMPVVVVISVTYFTVCYLKKVSENYLSEGVKLGIIWIAISIIIDLLMFSKGPMKMSFSYYLADIGLTYLIIPTITIGAGYLLEKK